MGFFNQSAQEIELKAKVLQFRRHLKSLEERYTNGELTFKELFRAFFMYAERASLRYDFTVFGHSFDYFTRLLVASDLSHKVRTNQELK